MNQRDNTSTYTVARAAVEQWWQRHNLPSSGTASLPMAQVLDEVTLTAISAIPLQSKPRVSARGLEAFERLVARLPDDDYDAHLVRQELIGRAPLASDDLPDALRAMLGAVRAGQVLRLLSTHGWGALRRPGGRRRTAPTRLGYCARHGGGVEQRQYTNGKSGQFVWRCMLCMGENRERHKQNHP